MGKYFGVSVQHVLCAVKAECFTASTVTNKSILTTMELNVRYCKQHGLHIWRENGQINTCSN